MKTTFFLKWNILALLFCASMSHQLHASKKVSGLLFDTGAHDQATVAPFLELSKSVGMDIAYHPLQKWLSQESDAVVNGSEKIAFFNFNVEFLKSMKRSPIAGRLLTLLKKWSSRPDVTTVLMFPLAGRQAPDKVKVFKPIFDAVGVSKNSAKTNESMSRFINLMGAFLSYPLEMRSFKYHTTLNLPRLGKVPHFPYPPSAPLVSVTPLPYVHDGGSVTTQATLPYGVYFYNDLPNRKNHVVVSSSSLINFSGVTENFQLFPAKSQLQNEMDDLVHSFVRELSLVASSKSKQGFPAEQALIKPKQKLASTAIVPSKSIVKKSQPVATAWMELDLFQRKKGSKGSTKKQLKRESSLLTHIFDAGLDTLWVSLSPNMYYSPIGKKQTEKIEMLAGLKRFTKQLNDMAVKRKLPVPQILVGFEITNNVYAPNLPKHCSRDCFGNNYPDIPRALDSTFWEQEVWGPLQAFLKDWGNGVSNGLPLGGIVLDLEMYGRKSTGVFLSTMGFELETVQKFSGSKHISDQLFSQIQKGGGIDKFYTFLEKQAELLGSLFKKRLKKILPGGAAACYAPNISLDWFYKGLYKGLGSKHVPMHLFSFTTNFKKHKKQLDRKGIYVTHSGVLLLSKLKSSKDFSWVDDVFYANNDSSSGQGGVWLNRFSRMVEDYSRNAWYTVEQTPMSDKEKHALCGYIGKTIKV